VDRNEAAAKAVRQNRKVVMLRPHLRDIPQHAFPPGFGVRPLRDGEGPIWTAIQRDAEPVLEIADDRFDREFGHDLPATRTRCFFVTAPRGREVGTISAWYTTDAEDRVWGLIHWVAVRPAFQGRGLAKAAMTHAMNRLAKWHDRARLTTSTGRLGAIKVYLDFGFRPDVGQDEARPAWRLVRDALGHPALEQVAL